MTVKARTTFRPSPVSLKLILPPQEILDLFLPPRSQIRSLQSPEDCAPTSVEMIKAMPCNRAGGHVLLAEIGAVHGLECLKADGYDG
jgi:hypothetical protein